MSHEAKEPTVRRGAAERYFLRTDRPFEWAVILVADEGGLLSIVSDWGSWSHYWPNHGDPSFKHFLVRMGTGHPDYLICKLGGSKKDFDFDASVRKLKLATGRAYRDKRISKERCQDAIAEVENLEHTGSADDFARQLMDSGEFGFLDFEELSAATVKRDSGALLGFLERLWPLFVGQLRAELAADYVI